jgi:Na+-driven multidrug efflux pump
VPGDAAGFAVAFLRPLLALLVFQVVEAAGIACLIGAGDTRTGMMIRGTVAVLNLPLTWALFHGLGPIPALGFVGIAWGTAISHMFGAATILLVLVRGRYGLYLARSHFWPCDFRLMARLLRVSVPAAADSLSVILGQFAFLYIVNKLGEDAIAAHGVAIVLEAPGYQSAYAFGTAAMALVGQYLGAERPKDAARAGWTSLALGGICVCLMGVAYGLPARWLFTQFCPHEHQHAAVAMGVPVLRLVAAAMPALACVSVFTMALRGAGDVRLPVVFTWVGFLCVRLPMAWILTQQEVGLGLLGAWLAMFADLYVRGAFFLWRFASGAWKRARV